ncbi:MAG: phosphohydrolase, partial [Bacteroidia bacterium]|nr:phosphohydrolase [Bacteroidia bacterium]
RLMYWQVYLHKTSLVAEQLMIRALNRAKRLIQNGSKVEASEALSYFLQHKITEESFDQNTLDIYAQLDDFDIISALKVWQYHDDFVLKNLSDMIINRELLQVKIKNKKIKEEQLNKHIDSLKQTYNISTEEAKYFVFTGEISNQAYQGNTEAVNILLDTGEVTEIVEASDHLNLKVLSKPVTKYYICYPKQKL